MRCSTAKHAPGPFWLQPSMRLSRSMKDGIIESMNPASEKLFGYSRGGNERQERQHVDAIRRTRRSMMVISGII